MSLRALSFRYLLSVGFRGFKFRLEQLQVAEADNRPDKQKDPSFMALDVYVGSLTRYYAGEWENVSERTARERGAAVPHRASCRLRRARSRISRKSSRRS